MKESVAGGQGFCILPPSDVAVVWFSTGNEEEEILAHVIVKSFGQQSDEMIKSAIPNR